MRLPDGVLRLWRDTWVRRRLLIAALVLALTAVPLIGTLGYEHAFVLGVPFSLFGVGLGVDLVERGRQRNAPLNVTTLGRDAMGELALWGTGTIGLTLIGQLWQPGCEPLAGAAFFVVGPLMSAALGTVCGLWGAVLTRRRVSAIFVGLLPLVGCTLLGLWRLYADPVVFAFDPFWGYFSGSIYDEAVGVDRRYLAYRAYNAIGATAGLTAFALLVSATTGRLRRPQGTRWNGFLVALTVALAIATATIGFGAAGHRFTATTTSIREHLSQTYVSDHFLIYYAPRSADARSIEALAEEHEYAWSRLHAQTGREPPRPVESFVFASPGQKRSLMGAGLVQVAAPWRNQIYLNHRAFPHPVLHHELAHIFAGTIGDRILKISRDGLAVNFGLVEGLATALAPRPDGRLDLHDEARVLLELDKLPPLQTILGPQFLGSASRRAYIAAGSFCLWLIEGWGFEPMAILYPSAGDFHAAYQTSRDTLERRWLAFLRERDGITPDDIEAQAQRFSATAVWSRPCAHATAAVAQQIQAALARGQLTRAIDGQRKLCRLEPQSPIHRLGLARTLAQAGDYGEAAAVLDALATQTLTVTVRANLLEQRGDVALATGRLQAAAKHYSAALALPTSETQTRILRVKLQGATEPRLAPWVEDYFGLFRTNDDGLTRGISRYFAATKIRDIPEHRALGDYLVARQLLNVQRPADAIAPLRRSLESGPGHAPAIPNGADHVLRRPEFVRAARIALVNACVQSGRFDRARRTLATLEHEQGPARGHRLETALWKQRIEFFSRFKPHGTPP